MRFHFHNLPPLREAEIELGDFTIIAGKNNSGKTYLAYALYGFLKQCRLGPAERRAAHIGIPDWHWSAEPGDRGADEQGPTWDQILAEVVRTGRVALRVSPEALASHRRHIFNLLARDFVGEHLSSVFQTPPDEFREARVEFDCDSAEFARRFVFPYAPRAQIVLDYDGDTLKLNTRGDDGQAAGQHPWLAGGLLRAYSGFLLSPLPHPFVLTGERFGIALFYRELDFTKNQLVELLQEHARKSDPKQTEFPYIVIDKAASRYAMPIRDNIHYTRSLPDRNGGTRNGLGIEVGRDLENLADGRFTAAEGELRYRALDGDKRSFDIPLHRASSSARALMDFDFYVRHDAQRGQLLIVDEPESHLDVDNQVALARLLVRLTSAGIRVLVTTHSDYFVKEINNLIMATRLGPQSEAVKRLDYGSQPPLASQDVRAYTTDQGVLKPCVVDDYGIEIPVFEQAARAIDARSRSLAAELFEVSGDDSV